MSASDDEVVPVVHDEGGEKEKDNEEKEKDDDEEEEEEQEKEEAPKRSNGEKKRDFVDTPRDDEFSSENFKIELGGLPKYYPLGQLKKLLNQVLQLDAHRVKPGGMGRNVAYVNFKDEPARFKAMTILDGYKWMKSSLTAVPADPAKDPMLLSKIDFLKVPKKEHEELPLGERITKAVTPLHDVPYEDQLKQKEKTALSIMRKFGNELAQMNPELEEWVRYHKIRRKGQICEMDSIVSSPLTEAYRNKCEFTIGKNEETSKPVVGFRIARYKDGSVEVGPVEHLRHLDDKMKQLCKLMEKYLEDSSYEPFDPFSHNGVWRQLTVRTTNNGDCLIVVVIHPQDLETDTLQSLKDDTVQFFTDGDGKEAGVTSIYFQQYGQIESGTDHPYEHLWGKTHIEETILGHTYKASPQSFLQVNTPACEELYKKIAEVADVDATTVVLDICCGVGTIGLSLADEVHKVIGVDNVEEAIENARTNAQENDISNAAFYAGKAEDYIDKMLERSEKMSTVAILDPPRAGLHGSVMNAIRKCDYLDRLVYVSCDPAGALPNFQALTRPKSKNYKGSFFVPIRGTPVDLFPDTPHMELIVVFERFDECKWRRIMDGNPRPKDQEYYDRIPQPEYTPKEKEGRDRGRDKRRDRDRGRDRNRDRDYGRDRNRDWSSGPPSKRKRNFGENTSWRSNNQNYNYQDQYQGYQDDGGGQYDNNFQADTWPGGFNPGNSGWNPGNQDMNLGMWNSGYGNMGSNMGGSSMGASNMAASNMAASNMGASNMGASNMGANNMGASNMGASNMGASNMGLSSMGYNPGNYGQGWNQGGGQNYGNNQGGGVWMSGRNNYNQ